jgi:HEAT repeat protein
LFGLWSWTHAFHSLPNWVRYPEWYTDTAKMVNWKAALGFEILGAEAQQAVPALIAVYEQNISQCSQECTSLAIHAVGPAAQRTAIPSYLRAATSSNPAVRNVAILALRGVDVEQEQAVPALVRALSDTDYKVQMIAAGGLGRFGTNAQQAVPALVLLLNDPNSQVRLYAANALLKIDPATAAKVGVKPPSP